MSGNPDLVLLPCPFCRSTISVDAMVCPICRREIPRLWDLSLEPPCRLCRKEGRITPMVITPVDGRGEVLYCRVCHGTRNFQHRIGQMVTLSSLEQSLPSLEPNSGPKGNQLPGGGLGTAALIFAFLFPLVGLILGIIAAAQGDTNKGPLAIVISIIMPFVYLAVCSMS